MTAMRQQYYRMALASGAACLLFASVAWAVDSVDLPRFKKEECEAFRTNMTLHVQRSFFDRKHAKNLGIAAVALGSPGYLRLQWELGLCGRRGGSKLRREDGLQTRA